MFAEPIIDLWYLSRGSFNCIFEIGGAVPPTVCRISVVPDALEQDEWTLTDERDRFLARRGSTVTEAPSLVYRARFMLTFLNRFSYALGPSFVQELGHVEVFAGRYPLQELERNYRVNWGQCTDLKQRAEDYEDQGYSVVVQKMEKLGDRWTSVSPEQIFALLWFFKTADLAFRFRHHDLSDGNILTRQYGGGGGGKMFTFQFGKKSWVIRESVLPVVIDLDFATVNVSSFEVDASRVGTYEFAPPDALCREYLTDLLDFNSDTPGLVKRIGLRDNEEWEQCFSFGEKTNDGYDYWSVGYKILKNLLPTQVRVVRALLSADKAKLFYKNIFNKIELRTADMRSTKKYLKALYINTVITWAIVSSNWKMPTNDPRYPELLFHWDIYQSAFEIPEVQQLHDLVEESGSVAPYRELIRYLMGWEPTERGLRVLHRFSKSKGQIFYPLVVKTPTTTTTATGQIYTFDPRVMENAGDSLFTVEDKQHLEMKI